MISIGNFNLDLLKIDKKSFKKIGIYYIGYITIKDSEYVNIHSVNIITGEVDGYIEEKMEINTYLLLLQIKTRY